MTYSYITSIFITFAILTAFWKIKAQHVTRLTTLIIFALSLLPIVNIVYAMICVIVLIIEYCEKIEWFNEDVF